MAGTVVLLVSAASLAHLLAARVLRRLLPLAALLRLTLVFPDRAPSRMAIALRANQAQHLRQRIALGVAGREDPPSVVAADLLAIVAFLTSHDRRTRGHAERVRAYADLIAGQLGFDAQQRGQLAWAALLHDVGKIGVPADVLRKPGRLTPAELEAVRHHPAIGHCLVAPLADWLGPCARVPLEHHEFFDGSGYPAGLAGLDISLPARIVSVADAFDVMTSTRAYRRGGGAAAARAELVRCAGSQFDPAIVRAFLNAGVAVGHGRGAALSGALSPAWMGLRWSTAAPEVAATLGAALGVLSVGGWGVPAPVDVGVEAESPAATVSPVEYTGAGEASGGGAPVELFVVNPVGSDDVPAKPPTPAVLEDRAGETASLTGALGATGSVPGTGGAVVEQLTGLPGAPDGGSVSGVTAEIPLPAPNAVSALGDVAPSLVATVVTLVPVTAGGQRASLAERSIGAAATTRDSLADLATAVADTVASAVDTPAAALEPSGVAVAVVDGHRLLAMPSSAR